VTIERDGRSAIGATEVRRKPGVEAEEDDLDGEQRN